MSARATIGAVLLAFATVAIAGDLAYADAAALSDRDEEALSKSEYEGFVYAHGESIGQAVIACVDSDNAPKVIQLGVIAQLDAQGRVVRTWRRDDDPLTL